jgi:hypothetical protein
MELCRGREQDDGGDTDNKLHQQNGGKLDRFSIDVDAKGEVGDDVEYRIIPVGKKDLEEDDKEPEGQNHQQALCVDKYREHGECPQECKEGKKNHTNGKDSRRVRERNHCDDQREHAYDLYACVEPVDDTVFIRRFLNVKEFFDHCRGVFSGEPL